MDGFLKGLAKHIYETHKDDLTHCTLVFPSRRAGVFFNRYLGQLVDRSLFAPEIVTINDLIQEYSALRLADNLSLVFRLYKIYKDVTKTDETFDHFYAWGTTLLSDFDDMDKYLVDARLLFANIKDLKEIDAQFGELTEEQLSFLRKFWRSLESKNHGETQNRFLTIWESLFTVYTRFREHLIEEGIAYEGMIYREVAERIKAKEFVLKGKQHYLVCGLNALNRCEEEFYDYLQAKKRGEFYWDHDDYYMKNPVQEAGLFQRRNVKRYPQTVTPYSTNDFQGKEAAMDIISIPSGVGQAQMVTNFVQKYTKANAPFDETAVVLCDEELLLPVLGAMPGGTRKVNVTMGYPMKLTPAYSLIKNLIDLQRQSRRNAQNRNQFYHKSVQSIINHQLVAMIEPEATQKLSKDIVNQNRVYMTDVELGKNDLFSSLFRIPSSLNELSEYFLTILKQIFQEFRKQETPDSDYQSEFVFQLFKSIKRLGDVIKNEGEKVFGTQDFLNYQTYFRLLEQHLSQVSVPFEGHPLEGLQVMGILETRALDFKNVIMLSLNDGTMPNVAASNSYIPYNLRRAFGLPAMEEQNAMYAYYFYRVLQRAERVRFVYNSKTDGMNSGEKSRYLYQLQAELNPDIKEWSIGFDISTDQSKPFHIEKNEKIMAHLHNFFNGKRKLSPSAFNTYLSCPMQFYFQYIAGLKEPEEVTEEVDARNFGILFHDSMEKLYQKYVGFEVSAKEISLMRSNEKLIEDAITKAFKDNFFKDTKVEITGRNVLIFEMIRGYILKVLEIDQAKAPFEIIGLEDKFFSDIPLFNGKEKIRMGGAIDRYDRVNGELRVIDYKSGAADYYFDSVEGLFEVSDKNRNKAALQTMIYSMAVADNRPNETRIKPGIYQLQSIFQKDFNPFLKCKMNGGDEVLWQDEKTLFMEKLTERLEELFHADIPFQQAEDDHFCEHCPYNKICHRG